MKLACNQAMFSTKLQEVSRIALHNPASSEYRTVLVQAENGHLTLRCTETHGVAKDIVARLPADVTKSGTALVDAALITELSQTYSKDAMISAERRSKHPYLVLTCGDSVANLTLVKRPLPNALPIEDAETIPIQAEPLRQCIAAVIHAAGGAKDQAAHNQALKGVHIIIDDYGLTAAATDSFRMSIARHPADNPANTDIRFTLPADTARELSRILTQVKPITSMDIAADRRRIRFSAETDQGITTEISSALLSGDFPDPIKLIPTTHQTRAVLSPSNAAAAAKAAHQFSGSDGAIRLYIHNQPGPNNEPTPAFTVAAMTPEQGDSVHTFPLQHLVGAPSRIAINPKFVLDAIQALRSTDEGAIELTTPSATAVFRNTDETGFNTLSLIMPMFIDWEKVTHPPIVLTCDSNPQAHQAPQLQPVPRDPLEDMPPSQDDPAPSAQDPTDDTTNPQDAHQHDPAATLHSDDVEPEATTSSDEPEAQTEPPKRRRSRAKATTPAP